jgi:hypothetical protein
MGRELPAEPVAHRTLADSIFAQTPHPTVTITMPDSYAIGSRFQYLRALKLHAGLPLTDSEMSPTTRWI